MKPTDVSTALQQLIPTRQPIYLHGPPGVGKSSLVKQAAKELDLQVCDLRAVLLDPVDLRGLPSIDTTAGAHYRRVEWCPPAFLPRDRETPGDTKGVLFLDELAQAPPLVQAGCLQLTLDRRIGEYELPPNWTVVAASNRQEDRAGAHKLITPLLNRFIHLDVEVSHDDWHAWAIHNGIAPEIRSFLKWRPPLLWHFDPSSGARAFPTPRSWDFVNTALPAVASCDLAIQHSVVAGCVGEGPAAEFMGFVQTYRDLPDIDQVLSAPTTVSVPKEPAVLYALSGAIVERCRPQDGKVLDNAATYSGRMPAEFAVLTAKDMLAVAPKSVALPSMQKLIKKFREQGLVGSDK